VGLAVLIAEKSKVVLEVIETLRGFRLERKLKLNFGKQFELIWRRGLLTPPRAAITRAHEVLLIRAAR
jgi:hypothetical protein